MIDTYSPYNTSEYILPTRLATDPAWNATAAADYYGNATGPWCLGSPDGDAFPSLPSIVDGDTTIADAAASQEPDAYLASGLGPNIVAGYAAQQALLVNALRDEGRAVYELLNNNAGTMTLSNMRPFSRGSVQISSTDPFTPPTIDPRYGSNPVDMQVLLATLHFNEQIFAQPAMMALNPIRNIPAPGASDDALMKLLKTSLRTEFHPSGTCAMLPLELGGVVDPNLLVYGTSNVRVVDASIFPMLPAAHLQAVVYGVAEKAADIIRSAAFTTGTCELANATLGSSTTAAPVSTFSLPTSNGGGSLIPNATGMASASFQSTAKASPSEATILPSHVTSAAATGATVSSNASGKGSKTNAASLSSIVSSAIASARAAQTSIVNSASGLGGTSSFTLPPVPAVVTVTKYLAPSAPASDEGGNGTTEVSTVTASEYPTSTSAPETSVSGCTPDERWNQAWVVAKARSDFSRLFGFAQPFFIAGN